MECDSLTVRSGERVEDLDPTAEGDVVLLSDADSDKVPFSVAVAEGCEDLLSDLLRVLFSVLVGVK